MYTKKLLTLGLNLILFILGIIGCAMEIRAAGWKIIRFYTFDSNFIGMVASGLMFVFLLISFVHESGRIPGWVIMLKYMATCVLSVTFLVVVFVLAPMYTDHYSSLGRSYVAMLFAGAMAFQHFLCPVISILTTLFFDPSLDQGEMRSGRNKTPGTVAFSALLLTIAYAIITITLNITGHLKGPYPFLMVRTQPIWATILWVIVILGLAYLIAWLLARFGTLLKSKKH